MFIDTCGNGIYILLTVYYREPNLGRLVGFEQSIIDIMAPYSDVIVIMSGFSADLLSRNYHRVYLTAIFHSFSTTEIPLSLTYHGSWLNVFSVLYGYNTGQNTPPFLSKHELSLCVYRLSTPKFNSKCI